MEAEIRDSIPHAGEFDISLIFGRKKDIEQSLQRVLGLFALAGDIGEAVKYVVFSDGKRIRPILGTLVLDIFDENREIYTDILSLIEFIHSYSLVHDDLPCMDNDDMRRGRPTLHRKYNEEFAAFTGSIILERVMYVLAGLLEEAGLAKNEKMEIISLFDSHIGFKGMVGGQIMDMKLNNDNSSLEQKYLEMIELKTARLIELPVSIACILSGSDEVSRSFLSEYARNIGMLFQLIDDLLEIISDEQTIGKSTKSDSKNRKVTAVTLFGRRNVELFADSLYFNAIRALKHFGSKGLCLAEFAVFLRNRKK